MISDCHGDCSGSQDLGTLRVANEHFLCFILGVGLSVAKAWGRDRSSKMTAGEQGYFSGLIKAMNGVFHKLKSLSSWLLRQTGSTTWLGHTMGSLWLLCPHFCFAEVQQRGWVGIGVLSKWVGIPSHTQKSGSFPRLFVSPGRQNSCSRLHKESVVKQTSWA